jgi:hypothetical protein
MSLLANTNVITRSIVVRDADGITLTRYVDYDIIPRGNATEIRRRDLPNNTTVFVDYEYEVPYRLDYSTLTTGLSLRYDFQQILSFYYYYNKTDHDIDSNIKTQGDQSPLQEYNRFLYGSELRWRWFNLEAEYEDDSSDLVPFEATRIKGSFSTNPFDFLTFYLRGNHTKTRYETGRGTVTFDSVSAEFNLRFNKLLEAELKAGYREEDGKDVDDQVWSYRARLKSRFRSIEMQLESKYLDREERMKDRDNFTISFKLVRYFEGF